MLLVGVIKTWLFNLILRFLVIILRIICDLNWCYLLKLSFWLNLKILALIEVLVNWLFKINIFNHHILRKSCDIIILMLNIRLKCELLVWRILKFSIQLMIRVIVLVIKICVLIHSCEL